MTEVKSTTPRKTGAHARGARGLSQKAAQRVGRAVAQGYLSQGKKARPEKTRLLLSTLTDLGDGTFQVMANTFVSVVPVATVGSPRPEVVNSVLTMKRVNGHDVLQKVAVPIFESKPLSSSSSAKVAQS